MDLPSTRRFVTAVAARLAVAGACAGLAEGLAILIRAPQAGASLSTIALLVLLYGGTLGLVGALLGLLAAAWSQATDGGRFVAAAFYPEDVTIARRPGWAYGAGLVALGAIHPAILAFCRDALGRYHHRGLIAALVVVVTIGVWLGALLLVPGVAALVGVVRPKARVNASAVTAGGAAALVWLLGIGLLVLGLSLYLLRLQGLQKMQAPQRAFAFATVATIALVLATPVLFLLARGLGRRIASPGWRQFPTVLAIGLGSLSALVATACAYGWATVKQLDFRPFAAIGVVTTTFLLLSLRSTLPADPPGPKPVTRTATMLAVLAAIGLAFFAGTRLGDRPTLRKVAMAQTGLLPLVSRGLQLISDRDHDGYAALLGGGDCDDGDPAVRPGAFDWPDDGIDQDCNGHQATLQGKRARAHAELPADVPRDLNVLLITIDALRADHVSAYGYARQTTPTLDALAATGVLFQNSWSHAPSTRYSIPAIITGRYPSTIKVGSANWPPDVLPENRLLPEMVKDLGYYTGGTFSYHYFAPGWGLKQGFDEYDFSLQTLHSMGGDPAKTRGSSAGPLTDKNIEFLEKHQEQKFFLWTHYYDTHFLFEPHPEAPETDFGKTELDLYDGEIRYTDLQLSRLFAKLEDLGLWDKTIIVITADHGEGFGEHNIPPNKRHGYHLYKNETKIPLIIRVPGLPPRVVKSAASHVDIVPTILDLLGQPGTAEPQLLGDSLLPAMLGQPGDADRKIFQEVWYEGPTSKKAVVSSRWHYIRNLVPEDTRELYDLVADPEEDHDRQGAPDEAELDAALAAWMDAIAIPADFAAKVEGALSSEPIKVATRLGDVVGDWLVLEGAEVVTPQATRGGVAQVDLIWRVKARPPAEWRIFTHLVADGGQRAVLNADHQPIEGLLPLSQATPGTYLRDRVKVTIPASFPPGIVRVVVGLWKPNVRAPILGKHVRDGAIEAAILEVVP